MLKLRVGRDWEKNESEEEEKGGKEKEEEEEYRTKAK